VTRFVAAVKLIIQIPCFNEEHNLGETMAALPRHVPGFDSVETLVVDDGSTDGTADVARASGVTYLLRFPVNLGLDQTWALEARVEPPHGSCSIGAPLSSRSTVSASASGL